MAHRHGRMDEGLHVCVVRFSGCFGAVWIPGMLIKLVSEGGRSAVLWTLHPLGMALFGWGLVRFGQWLGRNEEIALREWLRDALSGVITNEK